MVNPLNMLGFSRHEGVVHDQRTCLGHIDPNIILGLSEIIVYFGYHLIFYDRTLTTEDVL